MLELFMVKKQSLGMVVGLSLQYLLGIVNNLYVQFPDTKSEEVIWKFAWSQITIALHIILGVGLIAGAIALVVASYKNKLKSWLLPAWAGLISVLAAFIFGALFVDFQNDAYSLLMAVFFITAIFSYVWGIYKSG